MPFVGILLILAAAGFAYVKVARPDLIGMEVPAPPAPPPVVDGPSQEQIAAAGVLGGVSTGLSTGGALGAGLAGLEVGVALAGVGVGTAGAATAGALTGALLGAGPLGIIIGAGTAFYASHEILMNEVHAFRNIQFMMTPSEDATWSDMKNDTTSFPKSLEVWRHENLHKYEVLMTEKYANIEGQNDFRKRLELWIFRAKPTGAPLEANSGGEITGHGVSWAREQGIVQMPLTISGARRADEQAAWLVSVGYDLEVKFVRDYTIPVRPPSASIQAEIDAYTVRIG